MKNQHSLEYSQKHGFRTGVNAMLTRNRNIFLRLVGTFPNFSLMTATADEDDGSFVVCKNRNLINLCVEQLGIELGIPTSSKPDTSGREFTTIGDISFIELDNVKINEYFNSISDIFFELYDERIKSHSEPSNGADELYNSIAIDDSGDDVYLSDGVWLGIDGSLNDLGR